tara:strand:- start:1414 stop:2061 length:648 start_codon:yes stop_codon:yes gene_type:complete
MQQPTEFIIVYIILILLLIGLLYKKYQKRELTEQKSNVNNITYLVRRQENPQDIQNAADLLGRMAKKGSLLISKLRSKYGTSDYRVNRLSKRFKENTLSESLSSSNQTSYSVNKGESIVMCIRSKKTGELINDNTITFVLLHELGHLMSVSIGHNNEFWDNFRFILAHAIYWNIYTYQNFSTNPTPYCGISITDTPLPWTKYKNMIRNNELVYTN